MQRECNSVFSDPAEEDDRIPGWLRHGGGLSSVPGLPSDSDLRKTGRLQEDEGDGGVEIQQEESEEGRRRS